MYEKLDPPPHMKRSEAEELYPDNYILMQKDNRDLYDPAGLVLYIGDNRSELFALQVDLDIPLCVVCEGLNLMHSLGGFLVGE